MQGRATELTGSFRVQGTPHLPDLMLVAEDARRRTEVHFHGVLQQALPARVEHPRIVEISATGSAGAQRVFEIRAAQGVWRVEARSVQVHEYPALFGHSVPLAVFPAHRRIFWLLLLWIARFRWGRALIARLTAGKRRGRR